MFPSQRKSNNGLFPSQSTFPEREPHLVGWSFELIRTSHGRVLIARNSNVFFSSAGGMERCKHGLTAFSGTKTLTSIPICKNAVTMKAVPAKNIPNPSRCSWLQEQPANTQSNCVITHEFGKLYFLRQGNKTLSSSGTITSTNIGLITCTWSGWMTKPPCNALW